MGSYRTKQVLVIRRDLKMRQGKAAAQAAHASMAFLSRRLTTGDSSYVKTFSVPLTPAEQEWLADSFAKICVYVNSEEELMELHDKALDAGLGSHVVTDNGTTEFHGVPTRTALAVGPDYSEKIDKVTGSLPLL